MFRWSRCSVLLSMLLVAVLFVPCTGMGKSSKKKKESSLRQTVTTVSIKGESELDIGFGSSLKQKSKSKRPKGKDGDYSKGSLEFNGNFSWDRDHFAFSVKDAGSVKLTFDASKGINCAYRNIIVNGEKLHDKETLGPVSVDVTAEAGKLYRVQFESKKVTPAEASKMDKGGEDGDKPSKKEKKEKKKDKKKNAKKSEDDEGGGGDE